MARSKGAGPNQADLAAALNLSVSTVSRALSDAPGISDDVRRRVIRTAHEFGYRGRGGSARPPFERIAVLATLFDVNGTLSWVYQEMLQGIMARARAQDIPIESHATLETRKLPAGLDAALDPSVGLVFLGLVPDSATIAWLKQRGVAAVIVNGVDQTLQMDSVSPANYFGGRLVAEHLIALGHRKLAFVGGPERWTLIRRFHGFRDALADHWGGSGCIVDSLHLKADTAQAHVRRLRAWLPDRLTEATAVFCYNDSIAVSTIEAIASLGKSVPGDVSVAGFDDMPLATMTTPKLTTMRVDWRTIGAEALRQLEQRHASPGEAARELQIGGALVERQSTGPRK